MMMMSTSALRTVALVGLVLAPEDVHAGDDAGILVEDGKFVCIDLATGTVSWTVDLAAGDDQVPGLGLPVDDHAAVPVLVDAHQGKLYPGAFRYHPRRTAGVVQWQNTSFPSLE